MQKKGRPGLVKITFVKNLHLLTFLIKITCKIEVCKPKTECEMIM